MINPSTKVAEGVIYYKNGKFITVKVNREVILSAGNFGSPAILMRSGVGPKKHLYEVGVKPIVDLPVGYGLQVPIGIGEMVYTVQEPITLNFLTDFTNPVNILSVLKGQGPLTSVIGEGIGFMRTGVNEEKYPDVEIEMLATSIADGGIAFKDSLNLKDKMYDEKFSEINFKNGFFLLPHILHPKSKGRVMLRNKSLFAKPKIFGNFFSHPQDRAAMLAAIKETVRLGETYAFKRVGAKLHSKPNPYCKHHKFGTDPYWFCAMSAFSYPVYHDSGTCRMGPASDPWSVVDNELRVYGVKGLRVADASIMPEAISGHTHAPCMMIGEKVAHMIRNTY